MNATLATVPALLTFAQVAADPGPLAVPTEFTVQPGETWLSGRHGGAYVEARWLALSETTAIRVEHRSVREGRSVLGYLELADGRCVDLGSVNAAARAAR